MKTMHAPAQRSSSVEIKLQAEIINRNDVALQFINSVPNLLAILNSNRQIVYANKTLMNFLNLEIDEIIGQRPGEIVNCIHSKETEGGCGTTEFCRECGSVNSILESQVKGFSVKECRIIKEDLGALEFSVWSNKIVLEDTAFTIFALTDQSDEKRKKMLERVFFHDIMNTAGGLKGFVELLQDVPDEDRKEFLSMTYQLSEKLIEEINSQRQLRDAEDGDLQVNLKPTSSLLIIKEVRTLYLNHLVAREKAIEYDQKSDDTTIKTDPVLLRRVLGNLVKNALEATEIGEKILIGCKKSNSHDSVIFYVKNPGFIPQNIQLQLFQRSFSTKGSGRGLGTYSVKLFSEKYLKGSVTFISTEEKGTTFYVELPI